MHIDFSATKKMQRIKEMMMLLYYAQTCLQFSIFYIILMMCDRRLNYPSRKNQNKCLYKLAQINVDVVFAISFAEK